VHGDEHCTGGAAIDYVKVPSGICLQEPRFLDEM
jgi:hypothetical protein